MTARSRLVLFLLSASCLLGRLAAAEPSHGHGESPVAPDPHHVEAAPLHAAEPPHHGDTNANAVVTADPHHAAAPAHGETHAPAPAQHQPDAHGSAAADSHATGNGHGAVADSHAATAAHQPAAAHGSASGHHAEVDEHGIATAPDNPALLSGAPLESLMRLGESQAATGDHEGAITAYFQVLENHAPDDMEVQALIGLSQAYQALGERTRAVAILERLIKDHPGSPHTAKALLDAGRLHRALGADRLAMSRFYAVLQATLRIPDNTWVDRYRQLARTAQYEIAETHLRAGRYEEAERYFTRFSLLELADADKALGAFKVIEARSAAGRHEAVVNAVNRFVDQYPNNQHVPAALYAATTALRELGRADDALQQTFQLLQASTEEQSGDPNAWAYWQRRTGNELANTFFQRGEFAHARQIYDTLASLDDDPAWRLPANYQAALCRERLGLTEEAIAMYHNIVASVTDDSPAGIQEIGQMASWRITHLEDLERERSDISLLISSLPPEATTAATTP
ncbi:tetratricopeptide repeat protein [Actomonas aquatica]|uniref:Tetratricopeptide repeat protein n=1 Tax=Actomonas aquatica TaxID=2866162 RepID=A0ABZ1CCE3_9BACT|nr:tetratricopeptide repeat protein [Opitutus sp. WL0086]WRQ89338.1 tetratricopeptide repeat protein [Opitutus sp. WL0086]